MTLLILGVLLWAAAHFFKRAMPAQRAAMGNAGKGVVAIALVASMLLTGFSLWAIAQLLVNGDVPSFVLFGGLLVWALAEMVVINRAEPAWTPPAKGAISKDIMFLGISFVLLGVIGAIHTWLGYNPFG